MRGFEILSDEELWRLAGSQDGRAFGELFERYADAVYNHCFRRTGSWSLAEDLTSVVFMETWRRRQQVRLHGQSILPWLLAVANNAIRNAERSRRRYRRLLEKLPKAPVVPDQSEEAIGRVDDERTMRRILVAFARLETNEQDVLSLCDWAGLSYRETAHSLNIPIGTVRSRLARARARIRTFLDGVSSLDPMEPQLAPGGDA